jgi:pantetheine-phosphate adenylyltransferase
MPKRTRRIVIYPGSFDPVTNGHLDIVRRAARLFDHVVVAVSDNSLKKPLFTLNERRDLLRLSLKAEIRRGHVSVDVFSGLLVRYALKKGASAVVRGLRAISDFEYEFQMALMNRRQESRVETVFLLPDEKYTYLSSTLLKDILRLGGDVGGFVPPALVPIIRKKIAANRLP